MRREVVGWSACCLALGGILLGAGNYLGGRQDLSRADAAAVPQILAVGLVLGLLGALALVLHRRLTVWLEPASTEPAIDRRPRLALFAISFVALFVELLLIRYAASQVRVFAFYKNVPLIASFLGLGIGCSLGRGTSRQTTRFLLWLVPLAVFLSQGAPVFDGWLGRWASAGSSEHVLGDVVFRHPAAAEELKGQVLMGLFCVIAYTTVALLFVQLGRMLGAALERVPRLPGYTINLLGSLAGIVLFTALSFARTPPWVWWLVGLAPLSAWAAGRRQAIALGALVALSAAAVFPAVGETVWSPYQKLSGFEIPAGDGGTGTASPGYLVQISDVFYQLALDLRPETIAVLESNPFPHYAAIWQVLPRPDRVLVVGAGTGNDVAAALRAGAAHVDAVEIDPAILAMGRAHHPERPYDDPRVRVIVDDARRAFQRLPDTYDAVLFGLLDSHTQLGWSSLRLDNYVFTLESFAAARKLLRPGGSLVVTAAVFRGWFGERLGRMVQANCDRPIRTWRFDNWQSYLCTVNDPQGEPGEVGPGGELPSDDWPFLYLPERAVPRAYLVVVALLVVASIALIGATGLRPAHFSRHHVHLLFLGAGFLLLEVHAINRLALLFGTTWIVSAVTIALVLVLIVVANLVVGAVGIHRYAAYAALATTLLAAYAVGPHVVLGRGTAAALAYGVLLLSPVFFAGLIFSRSFREARDAGPALGANILGAALGGWAEYSTMVTGIRAMVLAALALYALSLAALYFSNSLSRR